MLQQVLIIVYYVGAPGSGKSLLSERIVTILPDLTFEEALEITKIHSITGEVGNSTGLITRRPFRMPHHTSSPIAIIGGGRNPKPRRNKFGSFWCTIFRRNTRI